MLDPRYFYGFFTKGWAADYIFSRRWVDDCEESFIETLAQFITSPVDDTQPPPPSPVKTRKRGVEREFTFADDALLTPPSRNTDPLGKAAVEEWKVLRTLPQIRGDGDPWQWWRENEARFPTLARMARIYLAIPGMFTLKATHTAIEP